MENQYIRATESKRKIYNLKILLLHLLLVSTYFITIYFHNYTRNKKDENIEKEAYLFKAIFTMYTNICRLATAFDEEVYNRILYYMFVREIGFIIIISMSHFLIFRFAPFFYIENVSMLYFAYILLSCSHDIDTIYFFYAIAIFFIGFILHLIGNADINLYAMLISGYSKILFDNFILFASLITFSFSYASIAVYLLFFKTVTLKSTAVHIILCMILFWILDWIMALVEISTTSITMFYLINRNSNTRLHVLSGSLANIYYCLGNISVGKMYFYLYNTSNYILTTLNEEEPLYSRLLKIILFFPLVLLQDFICLFTHSLRRYVLPYIGIYNSEYTKAVRNTNNILFDNMYIRLFDNFYVKHIFIIIFIMCLPIFSLLKSYINIPDNVPFLRVIFYTTFMTYFMWNILFSVFYTIGTTMNFVVVLFPNLLLAP